MDKFYQKGIKYFIISLSVMSLLSILGINSGMTEKEAVYLLLQSKESYFNFIYNTSDTLISIIAISITIWLFLFYLDFNIKPGKII